MLSFVVAFSSCQSSGLTFAIVHGSFLFMSEFGTDFVFVYSSFLSCVFFDVRFFHFSYSLFLLAQLLLGQPFVSGRRLLVRFASAMLLGVVGWRIARLVLYRRLICRETTKCQTGSAGLFIVVSMISKRSEAFSCVTRPACALYSGLPDPDPKLMV